MVREKEFMREKERHLKGRSKRHGVYCNTERNPTFDRSCTDAYLYIIMMVMTGVMAAVKYRIYTTGNSMKTSSRFMVRDQILVSTRCDLFIGETFSEIFIYVVPLPRPKGYRIIIVDIKTATENLIGTYNNILICIWVQYR